MATETLTFIARKYYYGFGIPIHKALRLYLEAAEKGDMAAVFVVGGLYMQGAQNILTELDREIEKLQQQPVTN